MCQLVTGRASYPELMTLCTAFLTCQRCRIAGSGFTFAPALPQGRQVEGVSSSILIPLGLAQLLPISSSSTPSLSGPALLCCLSEAQALLSAAAAKSWGQLSRLPQPGRGRANYTQPLDIHVFSSGRSTGDIPMFYRSNMGHGH